MKKLMIACASVLAASATFAAAASPVNAIGFEDYAAGTVLQNGMDDAGEQSANDKYFVYAANSGSEDASTVTAYETTPVWPTVGVPAYFKNAGDDAKYLNLSTEGGILWRSLKAADYSDVANPALGASYEVSTDGVYIDTMVQFTPTEDGADPQLGDDDKLAIWLNVATDDAGNVTGTNLCVRGALLDDNGLQTTAEPTTFAIAGGIQVTPGQWYRLTVKSIDDVTCGYRRLEDTTYRFMGFQIYLDGVLLQSAQPSFTEGFFDMTFNLDYGWLDETKDAELVALLRSGSVFVSLIGANNKANLTAVGFKGSGALDDFVVSTDTPDFMAPITALDFTLTVADTTAITAVQYVLSSDLSVTNTYTAKIEDIPADTTVTLIPTYAPWYGNAALAGLDKATAEGLVVTPTEAGAVATISATKVESAEITPETKPADIGITGGKFASENVPQAQLQAIVAWAQTNDKTPADVSAMTFTPGSYTTSEMAYLLNCAEPEVDTVKESFAITSITKGEDGAWVVTPADAAAYGNGKVELRTSTTVGGEYTVGAKDSATLFYKAFLVPQF